MPMKEIWDLQSRFQRKKGKKAGELASHPRFRAAYDFVLLREQAGENLQGLGKWWTSYQDSEEYKQIAANKQPEERRPRKRRPPRRNNNRGNSGRGGNRQRNDAQGNR